MNNDHEEPSIEESIDTKAGELIIRPLPSMGKPGKGLVEKLCAARKEIGIVPRSGRNTLLKMNHATHDDITGAVGPALANNGLWAFETVEAARQVPAPGNEVRSVVVVAVTWTDGESSWTGRWVGTSIDSATSDKHEYQVYSQVLKYAYAKTLKIQTGDPDVDQANPAGRNDQKKAEQAEIAAAHSKAMRGSMRRMGHTTKAEEPVTLTASKNEDGKDLTKEQADALENEKFALVDGEYRRIMPRNDARVVAARLLKAGISVQNPAKETTA